MTVFKRGDLIKLTEFSIEEHAVGEVEGRRYARLRMLVLDELSDTSLRVFCSTSGKIIRVSHKYFEKVL